MRIVGVFAPGAPVSVEKYIDHGTDPKLLLWRAGYTMQRLLSAKLDDGEIVLTAQITHRDKNTPPPRIRSRHIDPRLQVMPGEVPKPYQRVASYAIVVSRLGLLGTKCSASTPISGMWQLPGGGIEPGETPAEGVIREVNEETDQHVKLKRLIDLQSDHWIGRAPNGRLEDFQALRIIYTAFCPYPTIPRVLDVGGTTESASWVPLDKWRSLSWTSGARSVLDRHLSDIELP